VWCAVDIWNVSSVRLLFGDHQATGSNVSPGDCLPSSPRSSPISCLTLKSASPVSHASSSVGETEWVQSHLLFYRQSAFSPRDLIISRPVERIVHEILSHTVKHIHKKTACFQTEMQTHLAYVWDTLQIHTETKGLHQKRSFTKACKITIDTLLPLCIQCLNTMAVDLVLTLPANRCKRWGGTDLDFPLVQHHLLMSKSRLILSVTMVMAVKANCQSEFVCERGRSEVWLSGGMDNNSMHAEISMLMQGIVSPWLSVSAGCSFTPYC